MWLVWLQAKKFGCRPAEILELQDPLTAFYFDRAVYTFGSALEADLERAGQSRGKTKKTDSQVAMAKQQVMSRWLGTQKFADPVAAKRG